MSSIAPTHQWLTPSGSTAAADAYGSAVGIDPSVEWQMQPSEQTALITLLAGSCPDVCIEIGSRYGGSLQVLSRYAKRVISVDIDATCRDRLGPKYPNAEFVTGNSRIVFPSLMKQLEEEGTKVGFVLVDGDHSAAGVQSDIRALLECRPQCPMFVVMHDSFNPNVRHGIRTAPWADNPFVHSVELDYVSGLLTLDRNAYREMWGGLALAVLLPTRRSSPLTVTARLEHMFRLVYRRSAHWRFDPSTLARRAVRKCRKIIGSA